MVGPANVLKTRKILTPPRTKGSLSVKSIPRSRDDLECPTLSPRSAEPPTVKTHPPPEGPPTPTSTGEIWSFAFRAGALIWFLVPTGLCSAVICIVALIVALDVLARPPSGVDWLSRLILAPAEIGVILLVGMLVFLPLLPLSLVIAVAALKAQVTSWFAWGLGMGLVVSVLVAASTALFLRARQAAGHREGHDRDRGRDRHALRSPVQGAHGASRPPAVGGPRLRQALHSPKDTLLSNAPGRSIATKADEGLRVEVL